MFCAMVMSWAIRQQLIRTAFLAKPCYYEFDSNVTKWHEMHFWCSISLYCLFRGAKTSLAVLLLVTSPYENFKLILKATDLRISYKFVNVLHCLKYYLQNYTSIKLFVSLNDYHRFMNSVNKPLVFI